MVSFALLLARRLPLHVVACTGAHPRSPCTSHLGCCACTIGRQGRNGDALQSGKHGRMETAATVEELFRPCPW